MGITVAQSHNPGKTAGISLSALVNKNSHGGVLLLLSGGSSVHVLEYLTLEHPEELTIALVDERFTIDPKHKNDLAISESPVIERAVDQGAHFVACMKNNLSLHESVLAYEDFLFDWQTNHRDGSVVALLGVGKDAHTAGILPFTDNQSEFASLFEDAHWVQGYDAGKGYELPLRITVTATFLKDVVDAAVVYMVGNEKKEALAHLMLPFGDVHKTPVRLLRDMKRVFVYTDLSL